MKWYFILLIVVGIIIVLGWLLLGLVISSKSKSFETTCMGLPLHFYRENCLGGGPMDKPPACDKCFNKG